MSVNMQFVSGGPNLPTPDDWTLPPITTPPPPPDPSSTKDGIDKNIDIHSGISDPGGGGGAG